MNFATMGLATKKYGNIKHAHNKTHVDLTPNAPSDKHSFAYYLVLYNDLSYKILYTFSFYKRLANQQESQCHLRYDTKQNLHHNTDPGRSKSLSFIEYC